MADKQITVAVPEERVPEFYSWFAHFLAAEPGGVPGGAAAGAAAARPGPRPQRTTGEAEPWTDQDADRAAWLYHRLAPPARALFDLLLDAPGERFSGNDIAARLGLERGAHGVAGILAWPGRYTRPPRARLPDRDRGPAPTGARTTS